MKGKGRKKRHSRSSEKFIFLNFLQPYKAKGGVVVVVVVVVAATARLGAEQNSGWADEGLRLLFPSLAHLPVRAWSKVSARQ